MEQYQNINIVVEQLKDMQIPNNGNSPLEERINFMLTAPNYIVYIEDQLRSAHPYHDKDWYMTTDINCLLLKEVLQNDNLKDSVLFANHFVSGSNNAPTHMLHEMQSINYINPALITFNNYSPLINIDTIGKTIVVPSVCALDEDINSVSDLFNIKQKISNAPLPKIDIKNAFWENASRILMPILLCGSRSDSTKQDGGNHFCVLVITKNGNEYSAFLFNPTQGEGYKEHIAKIEKAVKGAYPGAKFETSEKKGRMLGEGDNYNCGPGSGEFAMRVLRSDAKTEEEFSAIIDEMFNIPGLGDGIRALHAPHFKNFNRIAFHYLNCQIAQLICAQNDMCVTAEDPNKFYDPEQNHNFILQIVQNHNIDVNTPNKIAEPRIGTREMKGFHIPQKNNVIEPVINNTDNDSKKTSNTAGRAVNGQLRYQNSMFTVPIYMVNIFYYCNNFTIKKGLFLPVVSLITFYTLFSAKEPENKVHVVNNNFGPPIVVGFTSLAVCLTSPKNWVKSSNITVRVGLPVAMLAALSSIICQYLEM